MRVQEIANFVYHSNGIEGIHTPPEKIMEHIENRKKFVSPLISNHVAAVEYVLLNCKTAPTLGKICSLHKILLDNVDKYAGVLRPCAVFIGGREAPKHTAVPYLLDNWVQFWNKMPTKEWGKKQSAIYRHCEYEYIHPFTDGNGRSGRLLLLWDLLNKRCKPIIYECDNVARFTYYKMLREAHANRDEYLKKFAGEG